MVDGWRSIVACFHDDRGHHHGHFNFYVGSGTDSIEENNEANKNEEHNDDMNTSEKPTTNK